MGHQTDEELYILLTRIVAGEKPRADDCDWMDDGEKDDFHRLAVDKAHIDPILGDNAAHPKP